MARWAYLAVMNIILPPLLLVALPFLWLKEKRRKTLFQRLGFQSLPDGRAGARPLWVHALSLGELLSCTTLIRELRETVSDRPIVFSVSTLSAMQMARERIAPFVDHIFYFPLDLWWPVHRVLARVNPALVVFIETDVWPGFQGQLRTRDIPAILVNGRLSPDGERACRRFGSLFVPALNTFKEIHPQSQGEAQRYRDVGVEANRIATVGNLKFDVAGTAPTREALQALSRDLGLTSDDVVVLAGSTHPGEEEAVLRAFETVRARVANAKLLLVPRHPARGAEVAALARRAWRVHLFSNGPATSPWDVWVVDAMGVLSKLYHVADVSFVGGSLVAKGGQNPLESAAAGCPVVFGFDMSDFPDIATSLMEEGAAEQIGEADVLGERWLDILMDGPRRERMALAGRRVVAQNRGATRRVAGRIGRLLAAVRG